MTVSPENQASIMPNGKNASAHYCQGGEHSGLWWESGISNYYDQGIINNFERRKQQQNQQKQQLEDAQPQQLSPKTEMRESRGRKVAPTSPETSTASDAFKATVSKPGAPAEVWTESQVLDFLDSDIPSDDAVGEPSWDPTADALVEMKDEEEAETDVQLASVHTSCRQGDDNRNNNAHHHSLVENSGDLRTMDCTILSNRGPEGDPGKADPSSNPQTTSDQDPYVEPNVIVIPNDNVSNDANDNLTSLHPSDLSSNHGESVNQLQGSEAIIDNSNSVSEQKASEPNEGHFSDSDASEEVHCHSSTPRSQLKLNTAVRPLTPPLGKSPGITQSKGKLKLKAKKNLKCKK